MVHVSACMCVSLPCAWTGNERPVAYAFHRLNPHLSGSFHCSPAVLSLFCKCVWTMFLCALTCVHISSPWRPIRPSVRSTVRQAASCRICGPERRRSRTWSPGSWTAHPARRLNSPGTFLVFPERSPTPWQMAPPGRRKSISVSVSQSSSRSIRQSFKH